MKVLALNFNHDAAIVVIDNGEIMHYKLAERLSRIKHDHDTDLLLGDFHEKGLTRKHFYDKIVCTNFQHYTVTNTSKVQYQQILFPIFDFIDFADFEVCLHKHHLYHAFSGFHNSGFDEAVIITSDGGGSLYGQNLYEDGYSLQEHTCITHIKYPNNIVSHFKYFHKLNDFAIDFQKNSIPFDFEIDMEKSPGWNFERKCEELGFDHLDAGKVMGLSQCIGNEDKIDKKWKSQVIDCNELQKRSQDRILNIIKTAIEKTGCKNVVLSGGFAYNCVANYYYLKHLTDINLYIDPIANDVGIALGASYYHYYQIPFAKQNRRKLEHVYLGHEESEYKTIGLNKQNVTYKDVAKLISEGNIVALFQGKSEIGQRALGNRSLLFDPRSIDGKDIVNVVKKRESFRPFAGTILLEKVNDWFDMRGLEESPFMLYAVDAKEGVKEKVPAVIHYDNTCRVQTVTKKQNKHFYNLIEEFQTLTGIPILLNTSFNIAGEPLVETFIDALITLNNSDIDYLYLPEISTLITVKKGELKPWIRMNK